MHRSGIIAASLLLAVTGAACSSDDSSSDDETTTTAAADESAGADAESEADGEASSDEEAGACVTSLEIVGADAEEDLPAGAWEPEMILADDGPHPDNDVDYDSQLEVGIAGFEIEEDEQFGLGLPVGEPDAPDGTQYYSFEVSLPDGGTISAGQTFITQTEYEEGGEYDGEIVFNSFYNGSERVFLGTTMVTITEITDDEVCGEIAAVTDTDLQTFAGVEGTFVAERIQAIEAAAESDDS